jgi:hypothetical protein
MYRIDKKQIIILLKNEYILNQNLTNFFKFKIMNFKEAIVVHKPHG